MLNRSLKAINKRLEYSLDRVSYQKHKKQAHDNFTELKSQVTDRDKCLIIANGPSLKDTDLGTYNDFKIITMNRAYVMWEELLGSVPFAHVCINSLVLEQFKNDLLNLKCPTFYNYAAVKNDLPNAPGNLTPILMGYFIGDRLVSEATHPFSSSGTVSFVCMNLAIMMGFRHISIVGLDHSFHNKGAVNQTTIMRDEDKNHFFTGYFPKGTRWELPDLERSEKGYRLVNEYCSKKGIKIINESAYSACDVFPRLTQK